MFIQSIGRIVKLGFVNFWRNGWLSFAATFIVMLTLLIVSVFLIFNLVIGATTDTIKAKIDLSVSFKESATDAEIQDLKLALKQRNDVVDVTYVSKQEALLRWQDMQEYDQKIREQVTSQDNPLPRSLEVKPISPESLTEINNFVSQDKYKPIVDEISYQKNKQLIEKLINITRFSKEIGIILSTIFIIISILVILNTIKLTIFTRDTEMEIMRLVGASDSFIRTPFLIEGALYGIFGTILSLFLVWLGLHLITPMVNNYLGQVLNLEQFFLKNFVWIAASEFFVAILISLTCSWISIRNNLKI